MHRLSRIVAVLKLAAQVLLASACLVLVVACGSTPQEDAGIAAPQTADGTQTVGQQETITSHVQPEPGLEPVDLVVAFSWLERMENMVHLTHAGDGSGRLYVVLQEGRIVRFDPASRGVGPEVFLDIRDRVRSGGERGIAGSGFRP